MNLTDAQQVMCKELGISPTGDPIDKLAETMEYAGFNRYITPDNRVFEKIGSELIEVDTPEIAAERRYLSTHKK